MARNDLAGWSSAADRRGGGDWAPANEPDNNPRAVLGRLAPFIGIQVVGLPLALAGLWLAHWWSMRVAAWPALLGLPDWATYVLAGAQFFLVLGLPALLWASIRILRRRRLVRHAAPRRRPVPVGLETSPMDDGIPAGQLVYRRFDSPALAQSTQPALPSGEVA